jgi:glycosyltransferase involved in cell wall biosynthesis
MPKLLIALPPEHPKIRSLQAVLDGTEACSGTNGSFIRAAHLLGSAGYQVTVSGDVGAGTEHLDIRKHEQVRPEEYDLLIAHQLHWQEDVGQYTFGLSAVAKSILWLQNHARRRAVMSFLRAGGLRIICVSQDHGNTYRAVRGFPEKVSIIYNLSASSFYTEPSEPVKGRLLFIGAITPTKGFSELMAIWSRLAQKHLPMSLAVAGSVSLHRDNANDPTELPLGVAEPDFERNAMIPWLASLPEKYKPLFLGALAPVDLRREVARAEAVIVNPSWSSIETFCCSAVDAQLCSRPVFSVARGGLLETVYGAGLPTLADNPNPDALADLIESGFSFPERLRRQGEDARQFCTSHFAAERIFRQWDATLRNNQSDLRLGRISRSPLDWIQDGLRLCGAVEAFERLGLKR